MKWAVFSIILSSQEAGAFLMPIRRILKPLRSAVVEVESYIQCGKCKAVYEMSDEALGRGKKVQCGVCEHSWWQTPDRLQDLRDGWQMIDMPEDRLNAVKENIKEGRSPSAPKFVKKGEVTIFIGNLPFEYGESEIEGMFAPFGSVNGVTVVRLPDGRSKGYAFVEMEKKEAGVQAIETLNKSDYKGRNLNVALGGKSD